MYFFHLCFGFKWAPRGEINLANSICALHTWPVLARVLSEDPIKRQSSTALFHYCYQPPTVRAGSEVMMWHVFSICPTAKASIRTSASCCQKKEVGGFRGHRDGRIVMPVTRNLTPLFHKRRHSARRHSLSGVLRGCGFWHLLIAVAWMRPARHVALAWQGVKLVRGAVRRIPAQTGWDKKQLTGYSHFHIFYFSRHD